jgi:hypothetical protein
MSRPTFWKHGGILATRSFSCQGDNHGDHMRSPQFRYANFCYSVNCPTTTKIYFDDNNKSFFFTILSATASTLNVVSKHLCVSSLWNMRGQDGGARGNLELMGITYIIDIGEVGNEMSLQCPYYVRVLSINKMGTGKSIKTFPSGETPCGFPFPPSLVSVSVINKQTLNISWSSDANFNNPNILEFKVERFCKSGTASSHLLSFWGEQEVVEFSTSRLGIVGGTFQVYFGTLDASNSVFLGAAKVTNGLGYVETHSDLSPHLNRGESICIGNEQYSVHEKDPFTSKRPLTGIYSGTDAETISVLAQSKSMPIAYDATADKLRNALERMPHINQVEVCQESNDAHNNGYVWIVTFKSNMYLQPAFLVET